MVQINMKMPNECKNCLLAVETNNRNGGWDYCAVTRQFFFMADGGEMDINETKDGWKAPACPLKEVKDESSNCV